MISSRFERFIAFVLTSGEGSAPDWAAAKAKFDADVPMAHRADVMRRVMFRDDLEDVRENLRAVCGVPIYPGVLNQTGMAMSPEVALGIAGLLVDGLMSIDECKYEDACEHRPAPGPEPG